MNKTDENQWFAIWEILFPGKPKPRSAYMNPDMCEDLSAFQEHLSNNAAEVVQQALETAGFLWHFTTEEESQHLRRVVDEALYAMQQEWLSSRTIVRPIASARHPHTQNYPRNSLPVGGLTTPTDSGIGLGSQTDRSYRRPSSASQQANLPGPGEQRNSTEIEPQVLTRLENAARNLPIFDAQAPTTTLAAQPAPNSWMSQSHSTGVTGLFVPSSRMAGFGPMTGAVSPIDLSFWNFEEDMGHIAPGTGGAGTVGVPSPTVEAPLKMHKKVTTEMELLLHF
ncbi:hypothetical protein BDP81DRAFT_450269 [Colletotrichum phormii]|uniref:Uncharacterized protein n=1 Tax=Colletotrichum phormii TaxID=359342 RepID=A0AAI9ZT57_9PEZI|nr:uncharacterized protein BDP81DRAFT_450269 [Colletotrichum phormii]KAK1636374.1 hypothetical protein BDP81DRAFT_450269 [Colletotrichum phormii]